MSIVLENAPAWRTGVVFSFSPPDRIGFLTPDDGTPDVMFHAKGMIEPNAAFLRMPREGDRLQFICSRRRKRSSKAYAWRYARSLVEVGVLRYFCHERNFGFIGDDIYLDPDLGRHIDWINGEPVFQDESLPLPAKNGAQIYYIQETTTKGPRTIVWGVAQAA